MKHVLAYPGLVIASLGVMQEAYIPLFVAAINLQKDVEGTTQRAPYTFAMGQEWIQRLNQSRGKDEVFAILAHGARKKLSYVGHMGLHGIKDGHATSGSMILTRKTQGNGFGTEAKLLLLYHAFYRLNLHEVRSNVKAFNAPSLGHLLKCGYQICGRFKEAIPHEGGRVDEILLQIRRQDFDPIWQRYQETRALPKLTDDQRALVSKETGRQ